jgi:hypothetical protein
VRSGKIDPTPEAPYARHFPSLEESNSPEIGLVFAVSPTAELPGSAISEKGVWWIVRQPAKKGRHREGAAHEHATPVQGFAIQPLESLSRSSSCLGIAPWRPRRGILARGSGSRTLLMTRWPSSAIPRRAEELTANQGFSGPAQETERSSGWKTLTYCQPPRRHAKSSSVHSIDFRRHRMQLGLFEERLPLLADLTSGPVPASSSMPARPSSDSLHSQL